MDSLDRRILKHLSTHGRESLRELGQRFNLSDNGIRHRLRRLKRRKILRGFTVSINPEAAGLHLGAVLRIETAPDEAAYVARVLRSIPALYQVYSVAARYNLVAIGRFKDASALSQVIEKRLNRPEILSIDVDLLTGTIRNDPPIP